MEFIKINPKHEVPVFNHDGQIITESRGIAKYFHEHFNADSEKNDHWYPKDPEKRKEVDAWLDWSKELHLALEMGVVGSYALPQQGCGWRDNYGIMACLISYKGKCKKIKLESHSTDIKFLLK